MAALLAEQKRSGLSIREFAEVRGIPAGTIASWGHRLRSARRDQVAPSSGAVMPVTVVEDRDGGSRRTGPGFVVTLAAGRRVEIPGDFDARELKRLMEVLATC
jgi:hypothetical protein